VSGVFVVEALDKGFVCGCQARHSSITANSRRFFDSGAGAGEIPQVTGVQSLHLALRMQP